VVVLALPRGGVPIGRIVADAIGAPLDVLVVRKLGAPGQPELALGAVASGGVLVLNDDILRHLGVDPVRLDAIVDAARAVVHERDRTYRGDRPPVDVRDHRVVLVDDGLATGATMRAALDATRGLGAARVVVAVPVAPPDVVAALRLAADEVVVVISPEPFIAVGAWYEDFRQVTDDEVRALLSGDG
jgi:predicted phosphoribosyltransferase